MALRNILEKGDPTLEKHCRPITTFDDRIHQLLDDMRETLIASNGVGLAAPQVGVLRRAVLVLETNVEQEEDAYIIELLNPEIIDTQGEQKGPEGCLSVPGVYGIVERPETVTVRAQDRFGKTFEVTGHGLTARAFCHEIDHLEGCLFLSKAERLLSPEELAEEDTEEIE
ncbi:MAG: peptide deformylase [Oscillospiraceae bacterium]|nr:peptide deformylase [Oscillospiraceae bacterium]